MQPKRSIRCKGQISRCHCVEWHLLTVPSRRVCCPSRSDILFSSCLTQEHPTYRALRRTVSVVVCRSKRAQLYRRICYHRGGFHCPCTTAGELSPLADMLHLHFYANRAAWGKSYTYGPVVLVRPENWKIKISEDLKIERSEKLDDLRIGRFDHQATALFPSPKSPGPIRQSTL